MNTLLKITFAAKPRRSGAPFVFFSFDGGSIAAQPLFAALSKSEQQYLTDGKRDLVVKEKEAKTVILPGTRRKIILVGIGKQKEFSAKKAGLLMRLAVKTARAEKVEHFAFWVAPAVGASGTADFYETVAANAVMANFESIKYKTPPPEGFSFMKEIEVVNPRHDAEVVEGLRRGVIIGEETNISRELANTPGGDMTPHMLAEHAKKVARAHGIKATVFDEKKMKTLGMGGVLGVAKGSDAPARFIILEYMKGGKTEKPIVLVGKGVTFDTGGLNLKPSNSIYEMHMDMAGGAAVIHALAAAARLKVKKNIVALVPAVENMPSGSSYRPGDVLRTMSGKTIEVLNTDAEGRVILADALEYAARYKPSLVVDVATLTGAAIVALGLRYSGLFTPDKKLEEKFRKLGEETGDAVWPLPLTAEYEDDIRGTFGDWANTEKSGKAGGGASTGAVFLWQFAKAYPWVHLDIAPRMTAIDGEYLAKGAAGTPVRLLARLLEE